MVSIYFQLLFILVAGDSWERFILRQFQFLCVTVIKILYFPYLPRYYHLSMTSTDFLQCLPICHHMGRLRLIFHFRHQGQRRVVLINHVLNFVVCVVGFYILLLLFRAEKPLRIFLYHFFCYMVVQTIASLSSFLT